MRSFATLLPLLMLVAASASPAQSNLRGLDPRNFDTTVPACTDFYQHANGGWLQANPVPEGFGSWGLFDELKQRNLFQLRQILEDEASAPDDELGRMLSAFYASGMNEAAIEAAAAKPLAPLFDRISALRKPKDFGPLLADLHARGIPVLFDFGAAADLQQPEQHIAFANQGGLGLPDRDYYLREDSDTRALLAAYRAYVERLLAAGGSSQATRDAEWVLQIETRLARASLALLQLRDPNNSYRPTAVRELDRTYPALGLKQFLRARKLSKLSSLSLAHRVFFAEANNLAALLPPEQWRAYFRFHVTHALAPYLSHAFADAHEALFLRTLRGMQQPLPRWQRVIRSADALLGDALGQRFVERHLPESSRLAAESLVQAVRAALRTRIETAVWLGTDARAHALAKVDALDVRLGHPLPWPQHPPLSLAPDDYAGNVLKAAAQRQREQIGQIGNSTTQAPWPLPAHAVNAYYDLLANQLVLPAGFLQPPLFDAQADAALNFGALGALIGRELMHGFDVIGSTIDAEGKANAWWSVADANGFAQRTKPLEAQFDAYDALGPLKVNGRLTLAENIADLAGLELAWHAFEATATLLETTDSLTPAQRFFLSWAQVWRQNHRDETLVMLLRTDVRAPARFRVNGPLANLAPFASAFGCAAGAGFVRPDAGRVSIW